MLEVKISRIHASAQLLNDNGVPKKCLFVCLFPTKLYILFFTALQFSVGLSEQSCEGVHFMFALIQLNSFAMLLYTP